MAEKPIELWTKTDHDLLAVLLDQITAAQMDMRALCDRRKTVEPPPVKTLAEAADILQAAAARLRDVIRHLEELATSDRPAMKFPRPPGSERFS